MAVNKLLSIAREEGLLKSVNLKGFRGFTLAEVLITLVIIGVIAAMTIPTLMNNTNKQEHVSRLKKAYSTMAQATNRIIAEEGKPRGDIGGWATSAEAVYNKYIKYLSKAKECGKGNTGCFEGTYLRRNGTSANYDVANNKYAFVIADGVEVIIGTGDFSSDCSMHGSGTNGICQHFDIDVNGAKGPNIVGIDAFGFSLKENGLVPSGCDYDDCQSTSTGWGCTCKVLREGAINY